METTKLTAVRTFVTAMVEHINYQFGIPYHTVNDLGVAETTTTMNDIVDMIVECDTLTVNTMQSDFTYITLLYTIYFEFDENTDATEEHVYIPYDCGLEDILLTIILQTVDTLHLYTCVSKDIAKHKEGLQDMLIDFLVYYEGEYSENMDLTNYGDLDGNDTN